MEIHKVSNTQIEELLDYLSTHRALVQGVGLGARSKEQQDRMWEDLAQKLNAHGRGATKTGQRWKRYWITLKHRVKSKVSASHQHLHGTGGGPPKYGFLSDTEEKVMDLIGKRAVFGDSEHRIPVFPISQESLPSTSTSTHASVVQLLPLEDRENYVVHKEETESKLEDATIARVIDVAEELPPRSTSPVHHKPNKLPTESQDKPPKKKTKASTKVEPGWVVALEERRVAAEEKLADAAYMMAQAATIHAQAANTIAQAMVAQEEKFTKLLELFKNNN